MGGTFSLKPVRPSVLFQVLNQLRLVSFLLLKPNRMRNAMGEQIHSRLDIEAIKVGVLFLENVYLIQLRLLHQRGAYEKVVSVIFYLQLGRFHLKTLIYSKLFSRIVCGCI